MKRNIIWAICICLITFIGQSCNEAEDVLPQEEGTFSVLFDNVVGDKNMSLKDEGSTEYNFETSDNQAFNISTFGYYVSKIKLSGPNGESFEDEMKVSANADDIKGYYHVLESEASSKVINLENVPAGMYDKITFTIGIEEDGVQQGAAGGILDPAEGAWFWNWNAGYIGFSIEGTAENSGQDFIDWGNGFQTLENTFAIHIGGWKDIPADSNGNVTFVNNVRTITLGFGSTVEIGENLDPNAHVIVDAKTLLDNTSTNFESTFAIHKPILGVPYANELSSVFRLDHVHQ